MEYHVERTLRRVVGHYTNPNGHAIMPPNAIRFQVERGDDARDSSILEPNSHSICGVLHR